MVGVTANGVAQAVCRFSMLKTTCAANLQGTKLSFSISGYSSGFPNLILNFPSEITGYVYSNTLGDVQIINYGKESVTGSAGKFPRPVHRPRRPPDLRPSLFSRGEHRPARHHRQHHRLKLRA